jgi:chaperonin GroEL
MYVRVLDSNSTKEVARKAISVISHAVKQTLGPGGNPIIIQMEGQNPDGTPLAPLITKDGVTVAEHVKVRDPAMNTIIQTIMQVAQKTVADGGDGTTTSVVLAEAIYKAGAKYAEQGANSIELYEALQEAKNEILAFIDEVKIPVKDEDVFNVAKISANGDAEIAQIVYDALKAVGEDGYIKVEDGYSRENVLDIVEGAMYQRGWRDFAPNGSLLVNDTARNLCELSDVAVLLYADKLDNLNDFQDFLGRAWSFNEQRNTYDNVVPLLIVAHDFSDDLKNRILQIRAVGKLPIAAIKSPADGSPNARTDMLEDLAAMLGGQVSSRGILELKDVTDEHLGYAKLVEISPNETVFYEGGGNKEAIKNRIRDLNLLLETGTLHPYDQDNIRLRKAKLSQGVAIVKAGGKSELEMREKKDRIEDALCAAKVAVQEGIVLGGGWTLYKAAKNLEHNGTSAAEKILAEALQAPIRQIIINAGQNPDVILTKMPTDKGYDARNKQYVDLLEAGIVDPAKVTKSALENAVSIAGLLLTTGGALISDINPEDGKANPFAGLMG